MSHSNEELDYSDDIDRDHFGRRDRAVDHGVSHPAAVKAAKGEPPCDCCHHYATDSDEQAGVLTWRKPTTYADCYVHASRCKERPDAEQQAQGIAYGGIVIDDEDSQIVRHGSWIPESAERS